MIRASYEETRLQIANLVATDPTAVATSINNVFSPFSIPPPLLDGLTKHLSDSDSENLVDFITRFEHGAEEPASSRAVTSAMTIALAYFFGGLVPLLPYLFVNDVLSGLYISVAVMAIALFAFGYVKTGIVVGWRGSRCVSKSILGGIQMMVVGGAAAGAAMGLVKLFDGMAGP
jgi:VIT1/CCC1 family predicted Fe2+/Mn2+ transporter